ncbi:putative transporter ESBP6 [Smittium culicis]|uniref:Putative transporter ESBP6 n=1 Tax=Smittium culicis TaxID=133412 RepID=A0A1R1Y641_9FUNG|nr:putative transporter ESBP6 [Smittium culicis]OMJ22320.1 putative transporter ESBP6 [Smittium culicis]
MYIPQNSNSPRDENQIEAEFPADTKRSWIICVSCFFCLFLCQGVDNSYGIYQNHYTSIVFPNDLPSKISWIGSITTAFMLITGIFSGKITSSLGFRNANWIGGFVSFLGLIIASFVNSIILLMLTQGAMLGIGCGFIYSNSLSITSMWFEKYRGLALGIAISGSGIGGLAISGLTSIIMDSLGHRWALRITAFAFLIIIGLVSIPFKSRVSLKENTELINFSYLKYPIFFFVLLTGFIGSIGYVVPIFMLPSVALQIGTSESFSSNLILIFNVGYFLGSIITGKIADYIGPANMFGLCTFFIGFFPLVFWVAFKSSTSLIIVAFFYGFFICGFSSLCIATIGKYYDDKKTTAMNGVFFFFMGTSLIIGNFAIQLFLDRLGNGTNYRYIAAFASACQIFASLFALPTIYFIRKQSLNKSWLN